MSFKDFYLVHVMLLAAPSETWGFMRWLVGSGGRLRSLFPLLYAFISFAQTPSSQTERERGLGRTHRRRKNEGRRRKRIFDEELGGDGPTERARAVRDGSCSEHRGGKMCGTCLRLSLSVLCSVHDEGEGGREGGADWPAFKWRMMAEQGLIGGIDRGLFRKIFLPR